MANVSQKPKDEMFQGNQGRSGSQSVVDSAKDMANSAASSAKDMANSAASSAKDFASSAASNVSSAANSAMENVRGAASNAASFVGTKAGDATHSAGSALRSAGESIRSRLPENETIKGAGNSVADSLDSAGRYLEEEGLGGIAEDMTGMIRKNPIPALLIGVGIGFLLGRSMSSSRNNY